MLINFRVRPLNENPLTNTKKVFDSLINEEAFGVKKEDKLDENKPPRLDTSVIADALFVKARDGQGFSETPTDILSAWLDKLGLNDVNSVDGSNALWVRFDMMVWGAGK